LFDDREDFESVRFGELEIEKDQVGLGCVIKLALPVKKVQCLLAIVGEVKVALELTLAHGTLDDHHVVLVILDNQDVHSVRAKHGFPPHFWPLL